MRPTKKLLTPGWAGELTDEELAWLMSKLARSPKVRALWLTGSKRLTPARIRKVARG